MCGFTVINIIIDSFSLIYPTHLFTFQFILLTCFALILVHIILPPLFLSLCLPACLSVSLFLSLSISSSLSHFLSSILFPLILFFSSTSFSQPFFPSNLCLVIFVDAVRHVHCLTVSLSIPEPLDVTAEWLCDICCEVILRGPT